MMFRSLYLSHCMEEMACIEKRRAKNICAKKENVDKYTWRTYNKNMTRELGNSIWRFSLWIRKKF